MYEYWISYEWRTPDGRMGHGDAGIRQATPLRPSDISRTRDNLAANLAPKLGRGISIVILSIYKFEQES
jgi:hypothetical protein